MIFRRTVGPKGQVVIPKDLREHLGLQSGAQVVFEIRGNTVIMKPAINPQEWVEEFASVVKRKLKKEVDIERVIEEEAVDELDLYRQ